MKIRVILLGLILLSGCSEPLPENQKEFAGLWKSIQTSLLITESGRLEYASNKGSMSTSVSMPIKTISSTEIVAGFLFLESRFAIEGKPRKKDGVLALVVDGETLYKTDAMGRLPQATTVPKLAEIRKLVATELTGFSDGLVARDFSTYLEGTSQMFQSQVGSEALIEAYQPFLDNRIVVRDWMEGEFILTREPVIDQNGILTLEGQYPKSPNSLKFVLGYIYSHPDWKLVRINLAINNQ